jgi:hypothetical protein
MGAWAVAWPGELYEPARKARTATTRTEATADLSGTSRRMGILLRRRIEAFAAPKEWRESSHELPTCQEDPPVRFADVSRILLDRCRTRA